MSSNLGTTPNLERELALFQQGYSFIAGLDEAGRGAWAGPVVAAAVILPVGQTDLAQRLAGLNDSKKLSPNKRQHLFDLIQQTASVIGIGLAPSGLVDQINVLQATRHAMAQAIDNLASSPDYLLLDHVKLPNLDLPQLSFPKADSLSLTVAAASIIAKVTRDQMMIQFNEKFPGYAFDRHKGYGTKAHREALQQLGACELHRLSYQPLKTLA